MNDYQTLPIDNSILLLEMLHFRFFHLLIELDPNLFKRTIQTEVLGEITLEKALQRFIWHNKHHMAQIENHLREGNV
ncbi:DinB family protein [Paenibacillus daejeonensis]|uniref:DinB family protein n=1 Tax=Paenibacillus daejeonensis TaxID=135193 RepID=UPI0012FBA800